ncbi:MAG: cytochrome c oxidase assembly protein [Gammaproteobacteria bacterium]|nr:cytochrome c oxidase assembly protein [Gammaproteobacteria bacterium]
MAERSSQRHFARHSNRSLTLRLVALAIGMFGFGYLLVPLYDLLCEITGIGGRNVQAVTAIPVAMDEQRTITVEFLASVNEYAPWEFAPAVTELAVHPGQLQTVKFRARNLTDHPLTGQAIPNVAPGGAAQYVNKTECFCFQEQKFEPQETRELVVQFYLDRNLPSYVDRVTLSYTMFVKSTA